MKHTKSLTALLLLFVLFITPACKKEGGGNTNTAPANLAVNAVVSTDGSGKVNFTATATNTVSYFFEFGNGDVATVPTGVTTYTYTQQGVNTYTVKVTARNSAGVSVNKSISITVNIPVTAPVLVWSDEFDTDGPPNPSKWGYDTGAGGWGNNELQNYTTRPENAAVSNGTLKIILKKEDYSGSAYTSARLLSKGKYSFKYGRVEARAKLPSGGGTWPAIWMLGDDIGTAGWPACGEIDIMEHVGNNQNLIYGTLHYPGRSGGNADGATKLIDNVSTQFHVYALEWSSTLIKIYADDQLIHTVANSTAIPFNHNFFFILNIAMGGNFGGTVDPAFTESSMEIDYIRVYQ